MPAHHIQIRLRETAHVTIAGTDHGGRPFTFECDLEDPKLDTYPLPGQHPAITLSGDASNMTVNGEPA